VPTDDSTTPKPAAEILQSAKSLHNLRTENTGSRYLAKLIETALNHAKPGSGVANIAESIIDDPALFALFRQWTVEKVSSLLRRELTRRRRASQLVLPGFEALPRFIPKQKGGRVELIDATLEDVITYGESMFHHWKHSRKREQLDRLIGLMRDHKVHGAKVSDTLREEGIQPKLPD